MAAYRAIIADMDEAGHWFPSLENEGGGAHPWARDYRHYFVRPPWGRGTA